MRRTRKASVTTLVPLECLDCQQKGGDKQTGGVHEAILGCELEHAEERQCQGQEPDCGKASHETSG